MFGIYRFILAIFVVFYHLLSIPLIGNLAVYSFFILSGYLMTLICHQTYGFTLLGFTQYAINRFYRLFPIYWAILLMTILLIYFTGSQYTQTIHPKIIMPNSPEQWFANISLIFPKFMPVEYAVRLTPAAWALTIELIFYTLIGLGLSKSKLRTKWWFLITVIILIYQITTSHKYSLGYGNILNASLPFSIGALTYFYKDKINKVTDEYRPFYIRYLFILYAINIFVGVSFQHLNLSWSWKIIFIISCINIVLTTLVIVYLTNINTSKKFRNFDRFLGDQSYPIYLCHWFSACLVAWLLDSSIQNTFVFSLILTLIISIILNKTVGVWCERIRKQNKANQLSIKVMD